MIIYIFITANVEHVVLENVDESGNYNVVDNGRSKVITCTAYNGSEPAMALKIEGEDNPVTL